MNHIAVNMYLPEDVLLEINVIVKNFAHSNKH